MIYYALFSLVNLVATLCLAFFTFSTLLRVVMKEQDLRGDCKYNTIQRPKKSPPLLARKRPERCWTSPPSFVESPGYPH